MQLFLRSKRMYCKKCGSTLPHASHFCRVCGTEIERAVQPESPSAEFYPSPPPVTTAEAQKAGSNSVGIIIFLALFVMLFLFGTVSNEHFATAANFSNVFLSFSFYGTAAMGMIVTARAGGIDLSIPFQSILASVIIAATYMATRSVSAGILLGLIVCVAIGFLNGRFITVFRVPAIFMTILTAVLCRWVFRFLSDNVKLFLTDFQFMDYSAYIIIFILAAACAFLLIYFTKLGIPFAMRAAPGQKDKLLYDMSYAASSVFAFMGGIILFNRFQGEISSGAPGYEITFIFAFFLAGCSKWFDNRIAPVFIILFGCVFMSVFENLMNLLNIPTYHVFIIKMIFILAAFVFDRVYRRNLISFFKKG